MKKMNQTFEKYARSLAKESVKNELYYNVEGVYISGRSIESMLRSGVVAQETDSVNSPRIKNLMCENIW